MPFSGSEYENRIATLRQSMQQQGIDIALFISMYNVAYFLASCAVAFGRPYACVVTSSSCVTISPNIDAAQPWRRSHGDNLVYTDWQRDNYWRAVWAIVGDRCFWVSRMPRR